MSTPTQESGFDVLQSFMFMMMRLPDITDPIEQPVIEFTQFDESKCGWTK